MSPYERCVATIECRVPDRVPAYTPTIACDVASKILGRRVNTGGPSLWYAEAKAWVAGRNAHAEFDHKYEEDLLELHRVLGIEVFRYGWRRNIKPTAQIDEHTFLCGTLDGIHQVWRWDEEVMNFIKVKDTAPKRSPEDWPQLARQRQKNVGVAVESARKHSGVREAKLQKQLGNEMMVVAGGGGLSIGVDEVSLMACAIEPGAVGDILDCQLEVALAQLEAIAARRIKVILGGGDMADKNGPLYSPQMFRELMLPRLKKLATRCRELGLHYVWRTDGNIWSVSDMLFIEAGMPGYGEVDRDATMELGEIRARYPNVVVWANASGDVLHRKSRHEVYDYCMKLLDESEGRCYFHGCSNTILPKTPPGNVWAMMKARDKWSTRTN